MYDRQNKLVKVRVKRGRWERQKERECPGVRIWLRNICEAMSCGSITVEKGSDLLWGRLKWDAGKGKD